MTRKLHNPNLDNAKSGKRILKPVIEKKRRDRINQSLRELRTLLLSYTSDVRLQNPKIEKAEILDFAVKYLQKRTDRKSNDSTNNNCGQMKAQFAPMVGLPHASESSSPTLFTIENAGFQQCMAQLTSYMHKITPAQRMSLIQELKSYTDSQCSNITKPGERSSSSITDFNLRLIETGMANRPDTTSVDKAGSPKLISLSHHSSCQPVSHSYSVPCHDYLSPPVSPYLSCSPSAYTTPPPFPSLGCHFSFPPNLSPLSSNTSFSTHSQFLPTMAAPLSFSPTLPLSSPPTLHFPSLTTLRSPVLILLYSHIKGEKSTQAAEDICRGMAHN
ncbi:hairy-related 11 [Diretmus argenteus]